MVLPHNLGNAIPFADPLFGAAFLPLAIVLTVWTVAIKGYALWHAARNTHKVWFIVLLIVNTLGILELVYLLWFRNKKDLGAPAVAPSSSEQPQQ